MANRAKSRYFEDDHAERFALSLHYNMPYQKFRKKGVIASLLLSTKNGSFEWENYTATASFNLFGGEFRLGERRHFFPALAPFEIVNSHQWHNDQPMEVSRTFNNRSQTIEQESPCWEIVTFDESKGERFSVLISHAPRDDVFSIQYRLNQIMNETKKLIEPFAPEIRKNYKAGIMRALTDEGKEMISEMRADWQKNAPMWDWN